MTDTDSSIWTRRLHAIREQCRASGLDALVLSAPASVAYAAGFHGSAGLLIVSADGVATLVTDGRYLAAVESGIASGAQARVDVQPARPSYDEALAELLKGIGVGRAGFEAAHVTVAGLSRWETLARPIEWVPTERIVERLRVIKDSVEIATQRRAARALAGVASSLAQWVRPGRTEQAVAGDVDLAIRAAGFSRTAFETIVLSGPNTAYPHARPTDRVLGPGDLVLLDFGGVLDGYCVDLTRMAAVGQPGAAELALFRAVREAQVAACDAVQPGVRGTEVDRVARDVLTRHGFGEAFVHGTGHGLGLEVHEAPRLARRESRSEVDTFAEVLEAGMVCTIEPGAYVSGVGGVLIEDDVLVTAAGREVLTEAPLDLLVV